MVRWVDLYRRVKNGIKYICMKGHPMYAVYSKLKYRMVLSYRSFNYVKANLTTSGKLLLIVLNVYLLMHVCLCILYNRL